MQTDLRLGDCLNVLSQLNSDSVDTIITDPPYGLEFMGKGWDKILPDPVIWQQALRVLKPGAMALVFGGTRTFHRLACALEDAGFEIRDCLSWNYGSGFPKSLDISKAIDAEACREELTRQLGRPPTREEFKKAWEDYRKVIGKSRAGSKERNGYKGDMAIMPYETETIDLDITEPQTDLAKLWNGWGTALKPAWEPIILAMKSCEGTFADNAAKYGVAGLNIDGGRIGTEEKLGRDNPYNFDNASVMTKEQSGLRKAFKTEGNSLGRWPANLLLDEQAAAMLDEQSGVSKTRPHGGNGEKLDTQNMGWGFKRLPCDLNDSGGASRFFYCAKASRSERNAGLEGMPKKAMNDLDKIGGSKCTMKTGSGNDRDVFLQNHHPTVKPLKLMEYLCTLTRTPTGGVVLDPFMGSGTTGVACVNTGRDFIGIEKEAEYFEIAKRRIEHAKKEKLF